MTTSLAPEAALSVTSRAETRGQLTLPDGVNLELQHQTAEGRATRDTSTPPLLFIHGSGHAAWCWQERFMPFFAAEGYDSYALSFRGQGASERKPDAGAGTLLSCAQDVASVVASLPAQPVVVSHSFGGLVVQKYVSCCGTAGQKAFPELAGTAYLAAAPPSGNTEMVKRIVRRSPLQAARITWAFVTKAYRRSAASAKDLFFSDDIPATDLERYAALLAEQSSPVGIIDVRRLSEEVPIPPPGDAAPPAFVAGGTDDWIVDVDGVRELAAWCAVEPRLFPRTAHDMMLDTRWREVANSLLQWLRTL